MGRARSWRQAHERLETDHIVRVLAISGSLRDASVNTALVRAAAQLAPAGVEVSIYEGLATLPPFNPDLDIDPAPDPVERFRAELRSCDAVFITSPEYAHGVPGVLKNALDWVVGSGELIHKPIALVNASSRATHALASLRETLTVMSASVVDAASITVPLDGRRLEPGAIVNDAGLAPLVVSALDAVAREARAGAGRVD